MKPMLLLCLAVLTAAPIAAAQESAVRVTLDEAIARGIAESQRLAELQAREEGAAAAAAGRRAAGLPAVALQGGYTRTNHVEEFGVPQPGQPLRIIYPDIPDNYRSRVDLQWPIYTGGRAGALERAARAEHSAAGADRLAAGADLKLEITRAFWAVVTAMESEGVLNHSLDNVDAHVRDLRSRLEQGLIPPNEVLTAEAQRSREQVLTIEASNVRAIAEADLRRLLGLDPVGRVQPVATLDEPLAGPEVSLAVVQSALHQRPERVAMQARVAAAEAREEAVASARLPQVAFNGGYDYGRPNARIFPRVGEWRYSWDLSVNGTWTLWDSGRRQAEQAEAAAATRAAETRVAEFDRQTAFELRQRQLELQSSRAAIRAAADGVRAATEARRVVLERFNAGVATSTDVLDAELAVLQADLDRTRALAGARLAEARLARAIGTPNVTK
jgi:outer membrane protein